MGFFKVLGGVALGVGAVAAAPFTGGGSVLAAASLGASLAGAGTVAAAAGAAAAGGAAAHALDEKAKKDAKDREEQILKAAAKQWLAEMHEKEKEMAATLQDWKKEIDSLKRDTEEYSAFSKQLVAMFGVGVAVAHVDGHFSAEEEEEIDAFIAGASAAALSEEIVNAIARHKNIPPTFEEAIKEAEAAKVNKEVIDAIITQVAKADNKIDIKESKLICEWHENIRETYLQ